MRVFRVEHPECGVGPYNAMNHVDFDTMVELDMVFNRAIDRGMGHTPTPDEDGIRWFAPDHHFGFESLEELNNWFGRALDILQEHYDIVEYEVPDDVPGSVRHGGHQVAFRKTIAIRIGTV